jgi:hypothetical protein
MVVINTKNQKKANGSHVSIVHLVKDSLSEEDL